MKLSKKLKAFKEKLEACPEISKVEFKALKSHIPNNVEATITLNTNNRPNLTKLLSEYEHVYEGISELNLLVVGKYKIVIRVA